MPRGRMHADEVHIDPPLVRRMLAAQFPQWEDLSLRRVGSAGTDNAIYRLGDDLAVRLPLHPRAVGQVEKEHRLLPGFAPRLPLGIPVPVGKGSPGEGYPWPWSIYRWLEGENWADGPVADLSLAAADLAQFIKALQGIEAIGEPGLVGVPGTRLRDRDPAVRAAIAASADEFDPHAMTAAWDAALAAPAWEGSPVWVHGDLKRPGNLLTRGGRLCAVIDFGVLHIGDPARDLDCAWTLFSGASRAAFRAALPFDDATWERARGWALTFVQAIPYYRGSNPEIVAEARHAVEQVLLDHQRGG